MNNFSIVNENNLHSSCFNEIKTPQKIYKKMTLSNCLSSSDVSEKIKRDLFELLDNTPQDSIGEKWQNYVIFKDPKKAVLMNYGEDQERYGNWMDYTVKIAGKGLTEKGWSFNELLEFLCFARSYIAYSVSYGELRIDEMMTHIYENKPYKAIYTFYNNFIPASEACKLKIVSGDTKKFIHIGRINDKKIKLSKICLDLYTSCYQNNYASLSHTAVKKVPRIMNFVETDLYPKALNEFDKQELIKTLGQIFWWICQAKPWKFGDPSIAEMLIRTLWQSKGFEQPAWKDGIIPWVEAMNEPDVEKFAENFHNLFNPNLQSIQRVLI